MFKPSGTSSVIGYTMEVQIPHEIAEAIRFMVNRSPLEAQWYHLIDRYQEKKHIIVCLGELLIPPQEVSGTQVETSGEQWIEYWNELSVRFGGPEKASEAISNGGAWCHSHVNMSTGPSGQDRKQFIDQCKDHKGQVPQLMMIFNKRDEVHCEVWDPITDTVFVNPQVHITYPEPDFTELAKEVDRKWIPKKYNTPKPTPVTAATAKPSEGQSVAKQLRLTSEEVATSVKETLINYFSSTNEASYMDAFVLGELEKLHIQCMTTGTRPGLRDPYKTYGTLLLSGLGGRGFVGMCHLLQNKRYTSRHGEIDKLTDTEVASIAGQMSTYEVSNDDSKKKLVNIAFGVLANFLYDSLAADWESFEATLVNFIEIKDEDSKAVSKLLKDSVFAKPVVRLRELE